MQHTSLSSINDQIISAAAVREKLQSALALVESICEPTAIKPAEHGTATEQDVRVIIQARKARLKCFPAELFADPAWDILLDLFAAKLGQRRVCVSSACIAAGVPATTALRWLGTLEQKGLVVRTADPLDARRIFVELSGPGTAAMHRYFNELKNEMAH